MRRSLYDLAALIARIVLGAIFVVHGWQKLNTGGLDGTAAMFGSAGVPMPRISAGFAMAVELGGGILLILGLLTPLVGLLLAADMLGAFIFVHSRNGLLIAEGGFELVGALGSAALLLAAGGAGRISLDHLLFGRRRERRRGRENAPAYVPPIQDESPSRIPPTAVQQRPPASEDVAPSHPPTPEDATQPQPSIEPEGTRPKPPDAGTPPL
ncbi:putative oxidoreductase [Streptosporangium album]|uniref:Putative oxidoreductase n=1 Tax=Streptosporangium album TaxID=47479 RepID=A0A7W7RQL5_9ACTN|nr:DoxX family membrane protein [Streptosporangium album]MBB4936377.1 putative oxidoreductase [Streptosporangium album]